MQEQIKILICDDNIAVHESLSMYLKNDVTEIVSVYNGIDALKWIREKSFSLVVLDIMMPGIDGIEVCREIRKVSEIPIIMLSAKNEEFDRILGLEIGADDYVTKPFSPREMAVRIKKLLKRTNRSVNENDSNLIFVGKMGIKVDGYEVTINEQKIDLTPKEIEILICFSKYRNKVLSREQILNQVWGYDYYGDTRAVDTLIKRLRLKLQPYELGFVIKSIYGIGYKMEV